MTTRTIASSLLFISLGIFAGCSPTTPGTAGQIPGPTISSAQFKSGSPFTVIITGEYFKIKSDDKMDVVTSLNGRNWQAATKIDVSSPTSYTATIPYSVAFPQVWVRVYGLNEEYSAPFLVQGQHQ